MITGTYDVVLHTPLGVKKGELVLTQVVNDLIGRIIVLGSDNEIENGTAEGNDFSFSGELKTAMGKQAFTCKGNVQYDTLTGEVVTRKAKMKLSGMRKEEQ